MTKVFSHIQGISYEDIVAPVAKIDYIWLSLAIVASRKWELHHMDVNNALLHGYINEEIYMEQPKGYFQDISLVYMLRRSLYILKQAPQAWYDKMDSYLLSRGFLRCISDHNVYMMSKIDSLLLIFLYVDDLLIIGSSASSIFAMKTALHDRFSMTDMGLLHYSLGLEIIQNDSGTNIYQSKYARDILDSFHMTYSKPTPTPF